jgi:hypothetical protein
MASVTGRSDAISTVVVVVGATLEEGAGVVEGFVALREGLDEQAANPNVATTMTAI